MKNILDQDSNKTCFIYIHGFYKICIGIGPCFTHSTVFSVKKNVFSEIQVGLRVTMQLEKGHSKTRCWSSYLTYSLSFKQRAHICFEGAFEQVYLTSSHNQINLTLFLCVFTFVFSLYRLDKSEIKPEHFSNNYLLFYSLKHFF